MRVSSCVRPYDAGLGRPSPPKAAHYSHRLYPVKRSCSGGIAALFALGERDDDAPQGAHLLVRELGQVEDAAQIADHPRAVARRKQEAALLQFFLEMLEQQDQ